MCGIVAAIGSSQSLASWLRQGLIALEYRGYDSFGIAFSCSNHQHYQRKQIGPPSQDQDLSFFEKDAVLGLGHTRWATHGGVTLNNAHPHQWRDQNRHLSLIHNGVVENLHQIEAMIPQPIADKLISQTDSERVLALLVSFLSQDIEMKEAFSKTLGLIEGSYAFVLADWKEKKLWVGLKNMPLYLGSENQTFYLSSDLAAFPATLEKAWTLSEGIAAISFGQSFEQWAVDYKHMLGSLELLHHRSLLPVSDREKKTYFEQEMLAQKDILPHLMNLSLDKTFEQYETIDLIGCGSSFFAAQFMAPLLRQCWNKDVEAYLASSYRDTPPHQRANSLLIALSQSGETADVLGLIRDFGTRYEKIIALTNRPASVLTRMADVTINLDVGIEYSVASTKSFTAQIALLSRYLPQTYHLDQLLLKNHLEEIFEHPLWKIWAEDLSSSAPLLILSRGPLFALAQESALKIREISYKAAFAIHSGELKHGSLALVDQQTDVLLYVGSDQYKEKNLLAAQEVFARGGRLKIVAQADVEIPSQFVDVIKIASTQDVVIAGILFAAVGQILALEMAQYKGYSVDKPRNLAKSVTVD